MYFVFRGQRRLSAHPSEQKKYKKCPDETLKKARGLFGYCSCDDIYWYSESEAIRVS